MGVAKHWSPSTSAKGTMGDKVLSNKNCYAQFAAVDWSNA